MDETPEQSSRAEDQQIALDSTDEEVLLVQLAARWAERFAPPGETGSSAAWRFRTAFEYLGAVTHGVEPQNETPT
jgi:hypothetical protein